MKEFAFGFIIGVGVIMFLLGFYFVGYIIAGMGFSLIFGFSFFDKPGNGEYLRYMFTVFVFGFTFPISVPITFLLMFI